MSFIQVTGVWIWENDPNQQIPILLIDDNWYVYSLISENPTVLNLDLNLKLIMKNPIIIDDKVYKISEPVQGVFGNDLNALIKIGDWFEFAPWAQITVLPKITSRFLINKTNQIFNVIKIVNPTTLIATNKQKEIILNWKNNKWFLEGQEIDITFEEESFGSLDEESIKKIALNLAPDDVVNFCKTSPFFTFCENDEFWRKYLTVHPILKISKKYKPNPIVKTSNDITWTQLFLESYHLISLTKKEKNYIEVGDYVKNLIKKNHIDVLRPYFSALDTSIGQAITYGGAELGNKEILDLIWKNRFDQKSLANSFPYHFARTTPEGADYLLSLGLNLNNIDASNIAAYGNLELLKHLVAKGLYVDEMSVHWALNNYKINVLKYLVEDLGIKPRKSDIDEIYHDQYSGFSTGKLKQEYQAILNYLVENRFWSITNDGIYFAVKNDRPDILDWIFNQKPDTLKYIKKVFSQFEKNTKVKTWLAQH